MENKMQEQLEGALYEQEEMYNDLSKLSKIELYEQMIRLEYQLDNLNEYGLGDSDCEKEKFLVQREYNMIVKIYYTDGL